MRATLHVAFVLGLAGCFDPRAATGVPCAVTGECPSGQVCEAMVCQVPRVDALVVGDAPGDAAMVDAARDATTPDAVASAPQFVGLKSTDGMTMSTTVGTPSGVAVGDLLIAFASHDVETLTITPPDAGWAKVIELANPATRSAAVIYVRFVDDPQAQYTWGFPGVTSNTVYHLAYRGVSPTTPIVDAASSMVSNANLVAPSVSTTLANTQLVVLFSLDQSMGTIGPIAGMRELFDHFVVGGFVVGGSDEPRPLPGPTGTRTAVPSDPGRALCFALARRTAVSFGT
ncbi:MAG: hypothetical protein NT062_29410 [Proteobacteria bacterium]|nr:hypothetical protein [Pseudomonadota bacterium]